MDWLFLYNYTVHRTKGHSLANTCGERLFRVDQFGLASEFAELKDVWTEFDTGLAGTADVTVNKDCNWSELHLFNRISMHLWKISCQV